MGVLGYETVDEMVFGLGDGVHHFLQPFSCPGFAVDDFQVPEYEGCCAGFCFVCVLGDGVPHVVIVSEGFRVGAVGL